MALIIGTDLNDDAIARLVVQDPFNEHFSESPTFIAHGRLGLLRALMRAIANATEVGLWDEIILYPEDRDEVQGELLRSIQDLQTPSWLQFGRRQLPPDEAEAELARLRTVVQDNYEEAAIGAVLQEIRNSFDDRFSRQDPDHIVDADVMLRPEYVRNLHAFQSWTGNPTYGAFAWWWLNTRPEDSAESVVIKEPESIR